MKQGDSIHGFLDAVRKQLAEEFREIKSASTEHLLYIKEDLIIPHVRCILATSWALDVLAV